MQIKADTQIPHHKIPKQKQSKLTFEKKSQHEKEIKRINNARNLKNQVLNEIYRNEFEFKDDDL